MNNPQVSLQLRDMLDREAARINTPEFIGSDPVQFPRRFGDLRDIELVAILTAVIAWGRRTMICRDAERMLELMEYQPYNFLLEKEYERLPHHQNLHRTFFSEHLKWYMRGVRDIYLKHGSLDAFAQSLRVGEEETPAWRLVEEMEKIIIDANEGESCKECLPVNLDNTALKRINMALRWLVRDDGIVDIGVWRSIPKSKLFIPLDVHVGNTARALGLLDRKANDRRSVQQLTAVLSSLRPEDPVYYDYALFGLGVEGSDIISLVP